MSHKCRASPAVATAEAIEAKKGDLTIRAMLRHDDPALLEKLRHQPLVRLLWFQGFSLMTHAAHLQVGTVRAVHCIARAVQRDACALKVVHTDPQTAACRCACAVTTLTVPSPVFRFAGGGEEGGGHHRTRVRQQLRLADRLQCSEGQDPGARCAVGIASPGHVVHPSVCSSVSKPHLCTPKALLRWCCRLPGAQALSSYTC